MVLSLNKVYNIGKNIALIQMYNIKTSAKFY